MNKNISLKSGPVQSIDRLFDIIELLASSNHGMTITELSNAVNLHVSTTHRLISALVHREYAEKNSTTGRYQLSTKFFQIGSKAIGSTNLVAIAKPHLERLADSTGETVHLVGRRGDFVVYLYKEDTTNSIVRMSSFVGLKSPMYCTAVGKAILSNLSDAEIMSIWNSSTIEKLTPNTCIDIDSLFKDLSIGRKLGYSTDIEENELGVTCIASAIFDFSNKPVAAISISAPSERINNEKISLYGNEIRKICNTISHLLGGQCETTIERTY